MSWVCVTRASRPGLVRLWCDVDGSKQAPNEVDLEGGARHDDGTLQDGPILHVAVVVYYHIHVAPDVHTHVGLVK